MRAALLGLLALFGCSEIIGLHGEPVVDASLGDAPAGDASGPTPIATGQPGPFLLAEYGSRIYWTDLVSQNVETADKVTGNPGVFAKMEDAPFGIAADSTGVYFSNSGFTGTIVQCPLTGCAKDNDLFTGGFTNTDVALSGNYVYWLQADGNEIDSIRETSDSGAQVTVATTSTNNTLHYLDRITTDGATLWWSDTFADAIYAEALGGTSATKIFTLASGSEPSAIHVDSGTLYFATFGADNGQGTVWYGAGDGTGGPKVLADKQHDPYAIATDATYVYWTTDGDVAGDGGTVPNGGVFRCAKTGCNDMPQELASGLIDARGLAVDDTNLYFTSFGTGNNDGAVWSLPKPP